MTDSTVTTTPARTGLAQPWMGVLALAIVVAVSLAFVAPQPWPLFRDWVSFVAVCGVPMLFVIGPFWHGEHPAPIGRLPQPARGLAFVALVVVSAVVCALVIGVVAGGGLTPPPPNAAHVAIMAVPYTFGLAVIADGWPFRLLRRPVLGGLLLLASAVVLSWLTYRLFANYGSFAGGPAYVAALDPHGPFDVWLVLTFVVTSMAVSLLWLHFGLWPVPAGVLGRPGLRVLVLALGVLAVTAVTLGIGVGAAGMTAAGFLTWVTVPFLFGSIVVLSILEQALPLPAAQPARGAASAAYAAVIGVALGQLYVALLPAVSGPLEFGARGFQGEVWLASALLGVTFPLLSVVADCFGFWPLRRPAR